MNSREYTPPPTTNNSDEVVPVITPEEERGTGGRMKANGAYFNLKSYDADTTQKEYALLRGSGELDPGWIPVASGTAQGTRRRVIRFMKQAEDEQGEPVALYKLVYEDEAEASTQEYSQQQARARKLGHEAIAALGEEFTEEIDVFKDRVTIGRDPVTGQRKISTHRRYGFDGSPVATIFGDLHIKD